MLRHIMGDGSHNVAIMATSPADHSVVLRTIRRAWGQRLLRKRTASLHTGTDYTGVPELPRVLRAISLTLLFEHVLPAGVARHY